MENQLLSSSVPDSQPEIAPWETIEEHFKRIIEYQTNPTYQIYLLDRTAQKLGIAPETLKEMFLRYVKTKNRDCIKPLSLRGYCLKLELFWEWLNAIVSEWDFFKILDYLAKLSALSLFFGTIAFILEVPDRVEQRRVESEQKDLQSIRNQYEAWQIINNPALQEKASNGGRKEALENLNLQGIDLSGIEMQNAILNEIFSKIRD